MTASSINSVTDGPAVAAATALRSGSVGWVVLASLGVSYVIAGHYTAWNFGLAHGGWGGMLVAVGLAASMYFALIFSLAELAALVPESGGGYAYARRAFGPRLAYATGIAILIEYLAAAAVVAVFTSAYTEALVGIGGRAVVASLFIVFTLLHARGVDEALKALLALAVIAVAGLAVFILTLAPSVQWSTVGARVAAAGGWFPNGAAGVWAALPFATAFFLAVEGVPMASEEARDATRTVPRAMTMAMVVLVTFALALVIVGPAAAGLKDFVRADDPIVYALTNAASGTLPRTVLVKLVNTCALVGLLACFFSALFACSRQVFALARAGLLPRWVGRTSRRLVPVRALIATSIVGCGIAFIGAPEPVFVMMVIAGTASYLVMLAAHWRLRVREPDTERPYRTPGGRATAAFAFVMSGLCFVACLAANIAWSLTACAALVVAFVGYGLTPAALQASRAKPHGRIDTPAREDAS